MTAQSDAASPQRQHLLGLTLNPSDRRQMEWLVLAFLALHVLLWVGLTAISHTAPPIDNVEQLVWSQSLQWGYYKHPPAPTWWVWGWVTLLGRHVWVTYLAAQASVVVMLYCVWRIGLMLTTPARAFAAMVLTAVVGYYGFNGIMANHNTLQLMPLALMLWALLLAVRSQPGAARWLLWGAVGVLGALSLLTKYSALIWFAVVGLWVVSDRRMRGWAAWRPVLAALAIFVVLLLPHVMWLSQTGFDTFRYAERSIEGARSEAAGAGFGSAAHWANLAAFALSQLGRVLPALLLLGFLRWRLRVGVDAAAGDSVDVSEQRYLQWTGVGPIALVLALGLAGLHLAAAWATTFFIMLGPWLMRWLPRVNGAALVRLAFIAGLAIEIVMAAGFALTRGVVVGELGHATRSNFPAAALGRSLEAAVQAAGHSAPIPIIAGDVWLAGLLSAELPAQPRVLVDSAPGLLRQVSADDLRHCDVLVVVDRSAGGQAPSAETQALMARALIRGSVWERWPRQAAAPELRVDWGVVPAAEPGCPLG